MFSPWMPEGVSQAVFFRIAAYMTVILLIVLVLSVVWVSLVGLHAQALTRPGWVQVFYLIVGMVGAPSAVCLWLGMLWNLANASRSSGHSKIVWFFFLIFGNWIAAPIYYFAVYRKQKPTYQG